jgi:leucyl-tRNA synthetase
MEYNRKKIEKRWQNEWYRNDSFKSSIKEGEDKKYIVPMFPYPSGNIHMGHMRNYTISDVIARYWRNNGYNVCHTIGWDSFGMPAETAAINNGIHPKEWTDKNISTMKQQMIEMGMSFDWSKEVSTCEKEYWKNEQEFFVDMWKAGFIERKVGMVNWDPVDKSVIANEQVINGKGWRSGATIEQKEMTQYYFKTTMFKDEMIESIKDVEQYWPDVITKQQVQFMQNGIINGNDINPFSDWCISRQRYWGTPIPMIHCKNCGVVPNENYPIEAPQDVTFNGIGNPIENHETWKNCRCPSCGRDAEKECDTMDTFVQSSWYFIRYISDIKNKKFDSDSIKYWFPIDYYIGGPEHATSHMIYARFFWRIFKKIGYISDDAPIEPFKNVITQGMVKNMGKKMSKSAGNGISPNEIVEKWGCDTIRMYIMFAGPIDQDIDWNDTNIIGVYRFINKIWNAHIRIKNNDFSNISKIKEEIIANQKIDKIKERRKNVYENNMRFNTIIAYSMETYNAISKTNNVDIWKRGIYEIMETIGPIIPHIYEEIKENIF